MTMLTDSNDARSATGRQGDADELLAAASRLRPVLAERASDVEARRHVPEETIEALHTSGLFLAVRPKRAGGYGVGLVDQVKIAAELAKGCPSTSWLFTLLGGITASPLVMLGEDGCEEIFRAKGPRTLICSVFGPSGGSAVPHDDGYLVSGRWGFASGCLHADFMSCGVTIRDSGGQPVDTGMVFFPLSEAEIEDTWRVTGMSGTGSNTVVANNIFVPSRRAVPMSVRAGAELPTGGDPYERWPLWPYFAIGLTGTMLGTTEAIFEHVTAGMQNRGVSDFDFDKQTDSAVLVERIGEARMRIDSAWLHSLRSASELDELTKLGPLDFTTRARMRADAAYAVQELRSAADTLLTISGASSFAMANPIQRLWRDLNVASRHATLNTNGVFEAFGRAHLGLPNITQRI